MKDITCRYDSGYIGFWAQALALNLVQVDQHGRFLLVTIHKHHKKGVWSPKVSQQPSACACGVQKTSRRYAGKFSFLGS